MFVCGEPWLASPQAAGPRCLQPAFGTAHAHVACWEARRPSTTMAHPLLACCAAALRAPPTLLMREPLGLSLQTAAASSDSPQPACSKPRSEQVGLHQGRRRGCSQLWPALALHTAACNQFALPRDLYCVPCSARGVGPLCFKLGQRSTAANTHDAFRPAGQLVRPSGIAQMATSPDVLVVDAATRRVERRVPGWRVARGGWVLKRGCVVPSACHHPLAEYCQVL